VDVITPVWARHLKPRARHFHASFQRPQYYSRYQQFAPIRRALGSGFRRWSARPTFYYEAGGIAGVFGVAYVYNLEEVPISGRRRFNVVNQAWERQLGEQQYQQVLQQYQGRILSEGDPRSRQVQRVLERLIPNSGLPPDYDWAVHVIDSEETNAFVIPGGKVFVFTGILPVCDGDDGLAAVLGHEIGHNLARHIAEQMSRNIILVGLATLGEFATGIPDVLSRQLMQLAYELPRGRAQEVRRDIRKHIFTRY
jgi:hypothetical protein